MEHGGDPACRRYPPAWWFSEQGKDLESIETTLRAKAICETECPVRQECWSGAVERREQHGVWGGVAFPEEWRRAMRLAAKAAAAERRRGPRLGPGARAGAPGAVPEVRSA